MKSANVRIHPVTPRCSFTAGMERRVDIARSPTPLWFFVGLATERLQSCRQGRPWDRLIKRGTCSTHQLLLLHSFTILRKNVERCWQRSHTTSIALQKFQVTLCHASLPKVTATNLLSLERHRSTSSKCFDACAGCICQGVSLGVTASESGPNGR